MLAAGSRWRDVPLEEEAIGAPGKVFKTSLGRVLAGENSDTVDGVRNKSPKLESSATERVAVPKDGGVLEPSRGELSEDLPFDFGFLFILEQLSFMIGPGVVY